MTLNVFLGKVQYGRIAHLLGGRVAFLVALAALPASDVVVRLLVTIGLSLLAVMAAGVVAAAGIVAAELGGPQGLVAVGGFGNLFVAEALHLPVDDEVDVRVRIAGGMVQNGLVTTSTVQTVDVPALKAQRQAVQTSVLGLSAALGKLDVQGIAFFRTR